MTHYDSPGRGLKQCAGCQKFYGTRGTACPNCGHTETVKKETIAATTYDTPGRGRKHCAGCQKFVGAKISICPGCGHAFEKKTIPTPPQPKKVEKPRPEAYAGEDVSFDDDSGRPLPRITTPAGNCPVTLKGTSEVEVAAWKEQVVQAGQVNKVHYTASALAYFARQFYPIGGDAHNTVKHRLKVGLM